MSGLLGGVLPAIFSQADRAKRYIGGLLADPVGRMQQAGGQAVDDLSKLGLLSEQAFNDPRNPMKLQDNAAARQLTDTYLNSVLNFAPVGMFVGPKSATWDKAAADKAQALAQKGVDPRQIWKETGTFKGPDGMWRQEIDDSAAVFKRSNVSDPQQYADIFDEAASRSNGVPIGQAFDHPQLFKAYPDQQATRFKVDGAGPQISGRYIEEDRLLSISDPYAARAGQSAESPALHELQHAVQGAEGWARGGTPESASYLLEDAKRQALGKYTTANSFYGDVSNQLGDVGFGQYIQKLDALSKKPNIKPSDVTNMSAWYEHSDKIREALGPMPNKAGSARDAWLQDAAAFLKKAEIRASGKSDWQIEGLLSRDLKKEAATLNRQKDKLLPDVQKFREVSGKFKQLESLTDFEKYQRLMGEAEARATQARMNMNMGQRREVFPLDSYDVPLDQLILRR